MGKVYEAITGELAEWLAAQRMFFVATAPLSGDGLVNCSPKGMDTFRVLGPREVGSLDLTGSGIEGTSKNSLFARWRGVAVVLECSCTGVYTALLDNCSMRCSTSCVHAVVRAPAPCQRPKILIFRGPLQTVAHLRENGRIVFMFCAFEGPPKIVRLHGRGEVLTPESDAYRELAGRFPEHPAARAIIRMRVSRISDSCGFSVPLYEYLGDRDTLDKWSGKKGPQGLADYRDEKNAVSLDGLPGLGEPRGQ